MNIKKIFQLASISLLLASFIGCSTTGNDTPVDNLNGSNGNAGTKVTGLGNQDGFGDSDSKFGNQSGATHGLHGSNLKVGEQIYYFDFNESAVHEDDKSSIQVQAHYLIQHPNAKILLEGYTDPRGSREYNIALGDRRAKAVLEELTEDGASAKQVRTVSFGAEKLASSGHTEADYALDRRVHLSYVEK